jgi:serine/threonine protein kinase
MNTSRPEHEAALSDEQKIPARPNSPPAIPDHELLRKIGGGSYGEVWLARNILGSWRAVKIVYRNSFEDERPFEREFAGIQKFEPISRTHESQVDILHVGRADGYFYYVMELADDANAECGMRNAECADSYVPHSLKLDLRRRGCLRVDECIQIGLVLTTALEHLHAHGLVHRDVKPSNIIFVNGLPKLADIGLVTDVEATRSFVGTEGFIPPEGPGSVQADLYSLGKVLYEMSMGRSRLDFPSLPANWDELPADQHARLLEFNEVLVKACESDPRRRYESAQEMQADLAVLQRGKSVKQERATQQRRAAAKKAALGAAIFTLFVLGAFWLFPSVSQHRTWRDAQQAERSLTSNLDALNAYSQGRYAYNKNTDADMTNAIHFFERAIALDPNFAEAYAGLASCYTWLDAPRNFAKARKPAEKAAALNPKLPEGHKVLGLLKYMLDWNWAEAEEELKLAIRLDRRDGETLRAYGNYLKYMGRTKESITVLTRAHEMDPRALSITQMLGDAFFAAGDYAQALKQYQSCLDLEPTRPATRYNMAKVFEEQGLFLKAIDLYQEDAIVSGEDAKQVTERYTALRRAYEEGGSAGYWRKLIEIDRTDPTSSACDLASDYAHLGDKKAVFAYLERSFQKREPELVQGLKTDRAFDQFRKEPEFVALLKKMKWE